MEKKSFLELYLERKSVPNPAKLFVTEVAKMTHKSEGTVMNWIRNQQCPDYLAIQIIAEHFSVDPEGLFPTKKQEKD